MKKNDTEQLLLKLPGGGKSIVEWSRPLWLDGADPSRPLRLDISLKVLAPDATGMPSPEEQTALDNLAFRIARRLPASAAHAMTVTGDRKRELVYYLRPRGGLFGRKDTRAAIGASLEHLAGQSDRPIDVTWTDDPGWERLLGIFPAHDPARWQADRALMLALAKRGDAIHGRRVVAHRVHFDSREGSGAFLREIRGLKFKADGGPRQRPDGRLVVLIERQEPSVAIWHLHPVVLSVKLAAERHGGTYEGWETALLPSLVPPPLTAPGGRG